MLVRTTRRGGAILALILTGTVHGQSTDYSADPTPAPTTASADLAAARANEAKAVQDYERSTVALWKEEANLRKSAIIHDQKLCGNRQKYLEVYATMGEEGRSMLKEACAHRGSSIHRKH